MYDTKSAAEMQARNRHFRNRGRGIKTLQKLASKIDTDRMKPPAFKMVLTAVGDFAYRTDDGITVCPIGALRE